ncbi:MAG: flagellar biosynthetic protein FliR [Cellvibrionaceae bacterium]|nr:flagellar biosynthetic protein FliR [Cellvibrionaceae bacterium]
MSITEDELLYMLQQYLIPFFRVGMMVMVMPVVSSRIVQARVRLAIAVLLTLLTVPLLPAMPQISLISLQALLIISQEVLVGLLVGFSFQIVFQVFILAGQFIAMKMGLGFASMNDPNNGVQTTVLSQFYLVLTTLVFVAVNGHLILLQLITQSFQTLQPGNFFISAETLLDTAKLGHWLFAGALLFALPVMTALLFINIAFGVMSRAAPQLNIFAVGFPFTLVCGLVLIWLNLASYIENFNRIIEEGFLMVRAQLLL